MKILAAACLLLVYAFHSCMDNHSTWKEYENTDYKKNSLIHDCEDFYLYKDSGYVVLTFEKGEYYAPYIKQSIPGVVKTNDHKVWIDSSRYDLSKIQEYFGEFTNRRLR